MDQETVTVTALTIVEALTPMQLFAPEHLSPILERIKAEVRATPTDISNEEGRKALKALVRKVASTKTFIEAQRVALVADEKKRLKAIDTEGLRAWNELEALQVEVRKPLTDWEAAEEARVVRNERRIEAIERMFGPYATLDAVTKAGAELLELSTFDYSLEFKQKFTDLSTRAMTHLKAETARLEKEAADKAERDRKYAEEQERIRLEREQRIADEAKAKADAEAKRREEAQAREAEQREAELARLAAEEKARLEREKEEAEERARKAEADRIATAEKAKADRIEAERKAKAAADKAEADRIAAEKKAEADRKKAAEQAEKDRVAAIEAERKRQEDARAAEEAEKQKREDDKNNRAQKHREALATLTKFGIDPVVAKTFVELVARKIVPHISITY
jgi:hypothetical protein